MRLIFAVLAAAGLAASPAFAADGTGFYVGAGVGDYGIKLDGNAFDANDFGYKVFGGYNFIEYLGAEIEYIDGGSPSDHGISIDMYGFNFSAVGIWPVTDQFDLFAKAGLIIVGRRGEWASAATTARISRGVSVPASTSPISSVCAASTRRSRSRTRMTCISGRRA